MMPVYSMQYQAVIETSETYFVDNQAYSVREGEGGKLIMLAWAFSDARAPDSVSEPVDVELVYWRPEIVHTVVVHTGIVFLGHDLEPSATR